MNQYSKIMSICMLLACTLAACSKIEPPIEDSIGVDCDKITLTVTNSLDEKITDLSINGVEVGEIQSGETILGVCLDEAIANTSSTLVMLQISGEYDDESIGGCFVYCGLGMAIIDAGSYEVDIIDVNKDGFDYSAE